MRSKDTNINVSFLYESICFHKYFHLVPERETVPNLVSVLFENHGFSQSPSPTTIHTTYWGFIATTGACNPLMMNEDDFYDLPNSEFPSRPISFCLLSESPARVVPKYVLTLSDEFWITAWLQLLDNEQILEELPRIRLSWGYRMDLTALQLQRCCRKDSPS